MSPLDMIPRSLPFKVLGLAMVVTLSAGAGMSAAPSVDPGVIRVTADKQNYNIAEKLYKLWGNVTVTYQDIRITGKTAEMVMDEAGKPQVARFFQRPTYKQIKAEKGEDVIVGDVINLYLTDDRFGAEGNVESHITTVAADPFTIRSDVQHFDNKNKVVSASGHVQVDYQGSKAFSDLVNVRMSDGGKADRVIFSGGARIKKETSLITGDKITVMVDSGNLIAEHNVKTDVDLKPAAPTDPTKVIIRSDYQQYDKATDMMIASGQVKIVYGDYLAVGPKATFKLKNGELDRIFLTGRPTITEQGRTITADKITITTNPKNFDAVGNVKVNFKADEKKPAPAAGTAKPAPKPAQNNNPQLPVDDPSDY